jgi:hypothetical protein
MSKACKTEMTLGSRTFRLDWPEDRTPKFFWIISPSAMAGADQAYMDARGTVGLEPPVGTKRFYRMRWMAAEKEGHFAWLDPGRSDEGGDPDLLKQLKDDAAAPVS